MAIKDIKSLLKNTMGLNATTVGASNFERAVRHRMKICEITEITDYKKELKSSEFEVKELIEEVVVPETWFFRNQQSFLALEKYIKEEWLRRKKDKKLKILSVPSSTGEEPYSLVMTLDKFGLTTDYFQVDAIDISTRLLDKARRGVYGKHSFRNKENDFIDAYFDRIDDTFVLHDDIRDSVNYKQGNILKPGLGSDSYSKYDLIFCRNLLIYFDRKTQVQAIENLHGLLEDDGLMFLGHAETGDFIKKYLTRANYPRAFAYHKILQEKVVDVKTVQNITKSPGAAEKPQDSLSGLSAKSPDIAPVRNIFDERKAKFLKTLEISLAEKSTTKELTSLRKVKKLADEGKLKQAGAICESILREDNTSAQAYYLLGLIRESEGKHNLVGELFRKAVYLNPNHYEAMIHLALHAGREGDADTAKKLHLRAQRVVKRNKT